LFVAGGNSFMGSNLSVAGNVTATTFFGNVQGNISGTFVVNGSNTQVLFNDSGNANATAGIASIKLQTQLA